MNKEMICKNCKYHYIEEISFDYPQSCCSKRMATTEEWCKCNDFEYGDRYIEQLQQENKQLRKTIDEAIHYIECDMPYLQEIDKEYEDVDGNTDFTYKEYNGSDLLSILKGEKQ